MTPATLRRDLASRLEAETVALAHEADDNEWHTYCAGVWVSRSSFLTAAHCVDDEGPVIYFEALGDGEKPYRRGTVTKYESKLDLALVTASAEVEPHPVARVGQAAIEDGDRVEVVGHPHAFLWSYVEGCVSSYRPDAVPPRMTVETLQIAIAFSHGNSGSGAFDADGNLIGLGSYLVNEMNGMGFFVHRNAIRAFLSMPRGG